MGCGLYGSAGNVLTFVSFCDKKTGVRVICGAGYSPENMVIIFIIITIIIIIIIIISSSSSSSSTQ